MRRVLFITRHYPPEISGGARRPYLMVKGLRELGHQVITVTPFRLEDGVDHLVVPHPVWGEHPPLQANQPSATSMDIALMSSIRNALREWLLLPEPEVRWSIKVLNHLTNIHPVPDCVITSSPPESLNIVGSTLAKRWQVPWIAEFRDTWVTRPHRELLEKSAFRRIIERAVARYCLRRVSGITAVSEVATDEMRNYLSKKYP